MKENLTIQSAFNSLRAEVEESESQTFPVLIHIFFFSLDCLIIWKKKKDNSRRNYLYNFSTTLMIFGKGDKETVKSVQYESQFNTRERCKECPTHPGVKTPMDCFKCGKCVCKKHSLILCEECI